VLNQSGVASLEAGSRSVDVGELVILAATLSAPVDELLKGDEAVALTPAATAGLPTVRNLLAGTIPPNKVTLDSSDAALFVQAAQNVAQRIKHRWPNAKPAAIVKAERGASGLAEQKAARSLGVEPFDIAMASVQCWGVTLTDRRNAVVNQRADSNATARSIQAIRGRVTRQLIDEIKPQLKEV
jgi:hypothetical protein